MTPEQHRQNNPGNRLRSLTDAEKWSLLGVEQEAPPAAPPGPYDHSLGVSYMAEVICQLASDAAADVLRKLPKDFADSVVAALPADRCDNLREILSHHEDAAGSMMAKEYLSIPEGGTIADAVDILHQMPRHQKGRVPYVYALDAERRLRGVMQTKDLVFNSPDTPVADIAASPVISVSHSAPKSDLINIFRDHRFLAVPVVDDNQRLMGVVTADNMLQAVRDQADRAIANIVGTSPEEIKTQSVPRILRLRLPWLSVNIVSGLICAVISGVFNQSAEVATILLLFVPVVLGLAESTGIQGATIVVRNMSAGKMPFKDFQPLFWRELSVGLLIGLVCALTVGIAAAVWKGNPALAIAIGISVNMAIGVSAVLGLTLPVLFRALRIDPATASGPLVLALCDIQTLLVYFNVANFFLSR